MSLEVLNTIGTFATVAVVAATAVAALVQLNHLRAANQISAMLNIGDHLQNEAFQQAEQIVAAGLRAGMADATFRDYHAARGKGLPTGEVPANYVELRQASRLICNSFEELGILVKNGVVDNRLFLDRYSVVVEAHWTALEQFIAYTRHVYGSDIIWENFEYLTVACQDWQAQHPTSYPSGVRRLALRDWKAVTAVNAS